MSTADKMHPVNLVPRVGQGNSAFHGYYELGNYVLEAAMNYAWTQKNRPMLVSLIDQALMIAADVDNDLFRAGESYGANDGEGIANLTYRVTALYTGRDAVLGTSAGLKHFGKRRLGAAVAST